MNYNAERENLLIQHINALTGLSNAWNLRASGLLLPLLTMSADEGSEYIFSMLPSLLLPFQQSSAQLGGRFYDLRREQSINALPKTKAKPPNFFRDVLEMQAEKYTGSTANKIGFLQAEVAKAIETENLAKFESVFKDTTSNMVTQPDRDTITDFILEDSYAPSRVRVASPQGCVFCQSMTGLLPIDEDDTDFHNHCNCVLDASFDSEVKFRQSFTDKVEKEREQAMELIRSGEAGTKPLKIGSEEWTQQLKSELAKDARDWRKDFEQRRNLTPEKKQFHREGTAKNVDAIAAKAGAVAKGEAAWTEKELSIMNSWKVSPTKLAEPRTKPLGNNNKDILMAMKIVRGDRQAKNAAK